MTDDGQEAALEELAVTVAIADDKGLLTGGRQQALREKEPRLIGKLRRAAFPLQEATEGGQRDGGIDAAALRVQALPV